MPVLKNLVISAAGDVGPGCSKDQLKRWVEANGGRWTPRVVQGLTHLICSKDAWKKGVDAVKQSQNLNAFIVSYDWLEDSLQRHRKLAERKYTWEVLRKQRKNRKEAKRLGPTIDTRRFLQGCETAHKDTGSGTLRLSSSRSRGGFFSSSLDDLRVKREAREVEERTRKSARLEPAIVPSTPGKVSTQDSDSARNSATIHKPTVPPATKKPEPLPPHPKPKQKHLLEPLASQQEYKPSTKPVPSLFPPCLKHNPPISSTPNTPTNSPTKLKSTKLLPSSLVASTQPISNKFKDLYHVYLDNQGFEYKLMLLRQNPYLNNFARYDLRLYESNMKPHVYSTVVRYTPPGGAKGIATTVSSRPSNIAITPIQMEDQRAVSDTSVQPESPTTLSSTVAAEMARLKALITPPTPSPNHPHKQFLTPLNSDFSSAILTFRHAFRDLTLLTWEERLDSPTTDPSSIQRLRAQAFQIEPFIWRKPPEGMPVGLKPAIPLGTIDSTYVRNRWGLPALDVPLGKEGSIGSALFREAEAVRKKEEELRLKAEVEERKRNIGGIKKSPRPNWNKPLFDSVSGKLVTDENERHYRSTSSGSMMPSMSGRESGSERAVFTGFEPKNKWVASDFFGE